MNSRENREGGTGGREGGEGGRQARDGGWVKRGDGARMETTAETEGGESTREEDRGASGKDEVSAGADERTLTSYYLLIANSFSLVAY